MESQKSGALDLSLPKTQWSSTSMRGPQTFSAEDTTEQFPPVFDKKSEIYNHEPKRLKLYSSSTDGDSPPGHVIRNGEATDAYNNDNVAPPLTAYPNTKPSGGSIQSSSEGVSVCLHDENLWRAFSNIGTEMIINRGGRRMFPHIVLSVEGLESDTEYSVVMEIVPADQRRYKFINNQWLPVGMADPGPEVKAVTHPDSPSRGSFWAQSRPSFSKVRLTNNKESSAKECADGNIWLLSMHKYKVIIKIREENTAAQTEMEFEFDESSFVAVTAYQNSQITQLKILNNPFAKAFRDCHKTSVIQKCSSTRRHGSRVKNTPVTMTCSPSPDNDLPPSDCQAIQPWCFNFPTMPFQQNAQSMSAIDQICRNAIEMSAWNPTPYLTWAAVGGQFPYPFWMKGNPCFANSLYSNRVATMTPDVNCMRLPVSPRKHFDVECPNFKSQNSSCSSSSDTDY